MEQSYVAASSDMEAELVRIWEDVLSVYPIGIHDAFSDLGGHSLAAMQVLSRCLQKFSVDIPLKTLFDAPTIASFAQTIAALRMAHTDARQYEEMFAKIESLSEEDAAAVLASRVSRQAR